MVELLLDDDAAPAATLKLNNRAERMRLLFIQPPISKWHYAVASQSHIFRGARCTDGATAACLQRQQRQQRSAGRKRSHSLVFSFVLSFFLGVVSVLPPVRG